ncbi:hypothetical protein P4113_14755 [Pseudomonas aeruginosa]|nr:hypothetical protein [Pseudomonas aeruginosa]
MRTNWTAWTSAQVLRMCVVHDLGEAIRDDIPTVKAAHPGQRRTGTRHDLVAN